MILVIGFSLVAAGSRRFRSLSPELLRLCASDALLRGSQYTVVVLLAQDEIRRWSFQQGILLERSHYWWYDRLPFMEKFAELLHVLFLQDGQHEDLPRAGDPFASRFDSVEPRAADICPVKLSEPSTWLTEISEIKGVRPITAFSESSSTLDGVCAVMDFSPFAVIGGISSLSLLMPILIAAIPFFLSEVLFADAIRPSNFVFRRFFFETQLFFERTA